jgi:Protein of Unknown function (DUF2784)
MRYDWLVTVILALHFGYLAYLVVGGFLAWRWPKAFFVHVVACVWGVLIVMSVVDCPLTFAEHWAREKAGQTPTTAGFIDRYLTNVMYPAEYVEEVRLAVALVVLTSWVGAFVLWRRRRARGASGADAGAQPRAAAGDTQAIDVDRSERAATV